MPPRACACRPDVDPFHHIFIERDVASWEALDACLERTERLLRHPPNRPCRLVVIDSIAYIFRDAAEFGAGLHGCHLQMLKGGTALPVHGLMHWYMQAVVSAWSLSSSVVLHLWSRNGVPSCKAVQAGAGTAMQSVQRACSGSPATSSAWPTNTSWPS